MTQYNANKYAQSALTVGVVISKISFHTHKNNTKDNTIFIKEIIYYPVIIFQCISISSLAKISCLTLSLYCLNTCETTMNKIKNIQTIETRTDIKIKIVK